MCVLAFAEGERERENKRGEREKIYISTFLVKKSRKQLNSIHLVTKRYFALSVEREKEEEVHLYLCKHAYIHNKVNVSDSYSRWRTFLRKREREKNAADKIND